MLENKVAVLERPKPVDFASLESGESIRSEIQKEAVRLLGYSGQHTTAQVGGKLYESLRDLEIQVLDTHEVRTYMALAAAKESIRRMSTERDVTNLVPPDIDWSYAELKDYKGTIPDHVLNKALQVKKRCPEVEFRVFFMRENPDPFLLAFTGSYYSTEEKYFIEVWDEDLFEGRKT